MQDWYNDIEKYKSGKLSATEMHALEKQALSDPFLADALEGIDQIADKAFTADIASLNQQIRGTKKKPIFTPLRIAAGVILLIGLSFTAYFLSPSAQEKLITENKIIDSVTTPSSPDSVTKKPELLTLLKEQDAVKSSDKEEIKTTATRSKAAEPKPVIKETKDNALADIQPTQELEEVAATPVESLAAKAEEKPQAEEQKITTTQAPLQSALRDEAVDKKDAKKKAAPTTYAETLTSPINKVVTGKVTSAEDGSAIPGVNVIIKGTTKGTITDEQGNYSIELGAEQNAELVFSFIGSFTEEIPVKDQSNIDTQLKNDVSQLSEVVVVGYGTDNKAGIEDDFPTLIIAEPNGGRRAFKKYLETNLQYPQQAIDNKVEGKVTVQFTVSAEGALNDFRVIKGIGNGCDDEVIRLIKSGPKWYPSRKGESAVDSHMRVRMRFKLP